MPRDLDSRTGGEKIINRQIRLAARPVGYPKRTDWKLTVERLRALEPGEALVGVQYISIDPAMRVWLNERPSYEEPVMIGDVMRAGGAGVIIASQSDAFNVGDYVTGRFGTQEYAICQATALTKVNATPETLPIHLGVLGLPGISAYVGLLDIGKPKAGDTVVVSGAAGAVGGVVGQIAKILGCRVVGVAGGEEKCRHIVDDLGFDAAINYKTGDLLAQMKDACPNRINIYFDNVGGEMLDAALDLLALNARVVICGGISQYNSTKGFRGPTNYFQLLIWRASMTGMLVSDHSGTWGSARDQLSQWLEEGYLHSRIHTVLGLGNFPQAIRDLFAGRNVGKFVLRV